MRGVTVDPASYGTMQYTMTFNKKEFGYYDGEFIDERKPWNLKWCVMKMRQRLTEKSGGI